MSGWGKHHSQLFECAAWCGALLVQVVCPVSGVSVQVVVCPEGISLVGENKGVKKHLNSKKLQERKIKKKKPEGV